MDDQKFARLLAAARSVEPYLSDPMDPQTPIISENTFTFTASDERTLMMGNAPQSEKLRRHAERYQRHADDLRSHAEALERQSSAVRAFREALGEMEG